MKKSPANLSPSLDQSRIIIQTFPSDFLTNQKTTKQAEVLSQSVASPTEEILDYLNRIGHEYPFCVNNKQRMNDPL